MGGVLCFLSRKCDMRDGGVDGAALYCEDRGRFPVGNVVARSLPVKLGRM